MPPASLPALAAISPGPSRARRASRRVRRAPEPCGQPRAAPRAADRDAPHDGRVLGPPSHWLARDARHRRSQSSRRSLVAEQPEAPPPALRAASPRARRRPSPRRSSAPSSSTTGAAGQVVVGHQARDLLEVARRGGEARVSGAPATRGPARRRRRRSSAASGTLPSSASVRVHHEDRGRSARPAPRLVRTRSQRLADGRLAVHASRTRGSSARRPSPGRSRAAPAPSRAGGSAAASSTLSRRSSGSSATQVRGVVGRHPRTAPRRPPRRSAPRRTRRWCWSSSSSKTSASSSRSRADGLDDLLALGVRGRLHEVGDLRGVQPAPASGAARAAAPSGTWPTNGSTLAQSRNSPVASRSASACAAAAGAARRAGRCPRPTTRHQPPTRASSISLARTSRAPSTLISWRSSTSAFSSTSSGRRSKGRRSSLATRSVTPTPCSIVRDALRRARRTRPPGDRHEHARDRRVPGLAEPDDQIVDPAEPASGPVAQRAADHQREVEDDRLGRRRRHGTELTTALPPDRRPRVRAGPFATAAGPPAPIRPGRIPRAADTGERAAPGRLAARR